MSVADSWIRSQSYKPVVWPGDQLSPAACGVVLASVQPAAVLRLVQDWLGRAVLRVDDYNMDSVSSFAANALLLVPSGVDSADRRRINLEGDKMRSGRLVRSAARGCEHARLAARHLEAAREQELRGSVMPSLMWQAMWTRATDDPQLELFQLVVPELGADGARVAETVVAHMDEPVDDLATVIRALLV